MICPPGYRTCIALLLLALAAACGGGGVSGGGQVADAGAQDAGLPDAAPDASADDADAPAAACEAGAARCAGDLEVERCVVDVSGEARLTTERCGSGERCDPEAPACREVICVPAAQAGCAGPSSVKVCNATGTGTFEAPCPRDAPCTGGVCEGAICAIGQTRCEDPETVVTCTDGTAYGDPQPCGVGQACDEGACRDLCTINAKVASYIGCEYWSLDLDNYDDASGQPHAIVVSNPNPELTASITVTRGYETPVEGIDPATLEVPPLGQAIYAISPGADVSTPGVSDRAFRVKSNIPITAHQFNPLNNVDVYSNDGTLLLPTNALGTRYWVMSWEQRPDPPLRGFFTVVNTSGQENAVTVRASAPTAPGPDTPRMLAGEERTFTLAPGEVLNMTTAAGGDDLTGTWVEASHPIGVFGGHECANVLVGIDRCDHIEAQLLPLDIWAQRYVGAKFSPRGTEPDVWRVLAAEDGTQLMTDPYIEGVTGAWLNRGEFVQFESRRDFILEASAPVSLGHYMVGSNWFGIPRSCDQGIDAGNPTGIGDPAFAVGVPTTQLRQDYIVLVPLDYDEDYLSVIIEPGTQVLLDGAPIPEDRFEPVGDEDPIRWLVARLPVADGRRVLTGDRPFGVESYGYDCHVSYAYPGGLNLEVPETE